MPFFKQNRPLAGILSALSATFLVACSNLPSGTTQARMSPAQAAAPQTCDTLTANFKFEQTMLEGASITAAGARPVAAMTGLNLPEHCRVVGKMHQRRGTGDQDFAIAFEMRLPRIWNGRFYHQVNGGIDGVVQPALGALSGGPLTGALAQGFAVISSDAGHTGRQNPRFGEDPQARADYGYKAVGSLTPMAKALIAAAYKSSRSLPSTLAAKPAMAHRSTAASHMTAASRAAIGRSGNSSNPKPAIQPPATFS